MRGRDRSKEGRRGREGRGGNQHGSFGGTNQGVKGRTGIFPHALLNEAVVGEALFADEGVARARRRERRIVVAQYCVRNLVKPLFARGLNGEGRG